eukprot:12675292-Alexandrium_andersonii.AAC.1
MASLRKLPHTLRFQARSGRGGWGGRGAWGKTPALSGGKRFGGRGAARRKLLQTAAKGFDRCPTFAAP